MVTSEPAPALRMGHVARPRLVARLSSTRRLALVCAPAGAGKTSLVAEWAASPSARELEVFWVGVGSSNGTSERFAESVATALGVAGGPVRELTPGSAPEAFADALVRAAQTLPRAAVLVLDDVHLAERSVHDALASALERISPQLRIFATARTLPPWHLARLRARDELVDVRGVDLRLGAEEAVAFLEGACALPLRPGVAEAVAARVEGWAAGLSLAARAALAAEDPVATLLSFSGESADVADYFEHEVFEREPAAVCDALLRTSVFELLSGPLCEAVLGCEPGAGQRILEDLDRRNLFLVQLDGVRRMWRHHRLFGDFLRRRAKDVLGSALPDLHRRASLALEQAGDPLAASTQAICAGEYAMAVPLIERARIEGFTPGLAGKALARIRALPPSVAKPRRRLRLAEAWALAGTGQFEEAEAILECTKRGADGREAAALRGTVAFFKGDTRRAISLARVALAPRGRRDRFVEAVARFVLARAYEMSGRREAAQSEYQRVRLSSGNQNAFALLASAQLGDMEFSGGRLRNAARYCEDALLSVPSSRDSMPAVAMASQQLGIICYEWNDFETAVRHLTTAIELGSAWDCVDIAASACASLARVRQAQGDPSGALRLGARAAELLRGPVLSSSTGGVVQALRARISLSQGDLENVRRWATAEEIAPEPSSPEERHMRFVTRARALLVEGGTGGVAAVDMLRRGLRTAREAGLHGAALEIRMLLVLALGVAGEWMQAVKLLEQVLGEAALEGWTRLFLDEGTPMTRMLAAVSRRRSVGGAYARALLALAGMPKGDSAARSLGTGKPLVEPVSGREKEVIALVAEGLSNPEIASRLFVSLATVKTHLNNLYGKLGVQSRTGAVARARGLGLV